MYHNENVNIIRNRFYSHKVFYHKFMNITTDDLESIKKDCEDFLLENQNLLNPTLNSRQNIYENVFRKIATSTLKNNLISYDKKIIFLIMCVDPQLVMYRTYFLFGLKVDNNLTDVFDKESKILNDMHDQKVIRYLRFIEKYFGFIDRHLLAFEGDYFEAFVKDKSLMQYVQTLDYLPNIFNLTKFVTSFESISQQRYNDLVNMAVIWEFNNQRLSKTLKLGTASFNIIRQAKLLELKSVKEQLIMFILLIDKDLKMLDIYENESNFERIEEEIKKEFGFYHKDLIRIEKRYYERFYNGKEKRLWLFK